MAARELAFGRLTEHDGLRCHVEGIGSAHPVATDFFADDVEECDVIRRELAGGEEVVDCDNLGGDATFGVYGAAAEDGFVVVLVGVEGRNLPLFLSCTP